MKNSASEKLGLCTLPTIHHSPSPASHSAYQRYEQFPYEDWKPSRQRIEFVRRHALGRSLIDIACGGHPVTEEVKIPYKVGVDISPKAKEMARWKSLCSVWPEYLAHQYFFVLERREK